MLEYQVTVTQMGTLSKKKKEDVTSIIWQQQVYFKNLDEIISSVHPLCQLIFWATIVGVLHTLLHEYLVLIAWSNNSKL